MTQHSPPPEVPDYRPLGIGKRLLILALAVGTAVAVMYLLLERPGGVHAPPSAPPSTIGAPPAASAPWIRSGPIAPERVAPIHLVRPGPAASSAPLADQR